MLARWPSPLGPVAVRFEDGAIVRLRWEPETPEPTAADRPDDPLVQATGDQLAAYFAGELERFDLPLRPAGSEFQKAVWRCMVRIPKGRTRTYGEVADELGRPARAVGTACGQNPIPLIIPCHRIVAADGRLGGFSASRGVEDKVWLLRHERVLL